MSEIKATILWILIIPLVFIIDFILYFIGIFNKNYRQLYMKPFKQWLQKESEEE